MTFRLGTLGTLGILTTTLLAACGHRHGGASEPARSPATQSSDEQGAPAGDPGSGAAYGAPEASSPAPASPAEGAYAEGESARAADAAKAEESKRPGLGTSWGESRSSRVSTTTFVRESPSAPFGTAMFFYNDENGVAAMTRGGYVDWSDSVTSLSHGITVTIAGPGGSPLRAARVNGRTYAVGRDGDRYTIRIDNQSSVRLEAVATVDGLDVIDGDDGDIAKRGYVIAPHDTLEIEGFRESQGSVRAFRFGRTDDSYASRRGKGRNVGVIGVALFEEQGSDWRWTPEEIERRRGADPFPARFAPPPPSQWRAH